MKSITRFYSLTFGINGNGHAHFNGIPFRVKQINVKSVVVDDGTNSDLGLGYFVLWSDCMPNTPLSLFSGSNTITTWDGTNPVQCNLAPNGLTTSQISYYVNPPQLYSGQIGFRISNLDNSIPLFLNPITLGIILEFISEEE